MNGMTRACRYDRIPSTNPGAEPPRDARDSGSARSHSLHLEVAPQINCKWSPTWSLRRHQAICLLGAHDDVTYTEFQACTACTAIPK